MDNKMQEEAIRRVREMQSSSRAERGFSQPQKPAESKPREESENRALSNTADAQPTDALSGLFKDKEKLLLLLLIMLLSQESTNTELVLALLYIIV